MGPTTPLQNRRRPDDVAIRIVCSNQVSDGRRRVPVSVPPFIGREGPLALLQAAAEEMTDTGRGRLVVVAGSAGVGKTRLCAELAARLTPDGDVVWSRCWGEGGDPPLWPWPDVLAELERRRGGSAKVRSVQGADRFARFCAVVEELRERVTAAPAVVLLDDLHAAAGDAVLLTRFIARSLHRLPMLLVATWRRGPNDGDEVALAALEREATVIELAPFDDRELAAYVQGARGRPADRGEVAALLGVTGGTPLYVAEAVLDAEQSGGRSGLAVVAERRLGGLDTDRRLVLAAAAVLGDGATLDEVVAVSGLAPSTVTAALDAGLGLAGLVDHQVAFSHGLVRDAVVEALAPEERRAVHAAAAIAVVGGDVRASVRRAGHVLAASTGTDQDRCAAIQRCLDAAAALQRAWEFTRAADWAARGLALSTDAMPAAVRAELALTRGDALRAAGRLADARAAFELAVEPADHCGDARLLARAALGVAGVWVEEQRDELSRRRTLTLCRRALAALGEGDAGELAALLRVRLAAEAAYDGSSAEGLHAAVEAVRALGLPAATAEALSLFHHTLLAPAHEAERLAVADELLDVAAAHGEGSPFPLFGLCWRTADLYLAGDAGAERAFVELRTRANTLGSQSIGYIAAVMDVMRTIRRGDLGTAESMAAEVLRLGEEVGDADALGYYGAHLLAIRWVQDRVAEMRPMVDAVMSSASLRRRDRIYPAVRAYALAREGDDHAARAAVDALVDEGLETVVDFSNGLATLGAIVETAAALGDGQLAERAAAVMEPYAGRPVMASLAVICLGPVDRFLGVARATAERYDDAIEHFERALVLNRRLGNCAVEPLIHAGLADALRRRGDTGDSVRAGTHAAEAVRLGIELNLADRVTTWQEATRRAAAETTPPAIAAVDGVLERGDATWRVTIDGRTATVDDVVGLRYMATLVARPDTDIPAAELSAALTGADVTATARGAPALDERARREYRRRLEELERELDLADRRADPERSRRAAAERTALLERLRLDAGLGGRARRLSDEGERCRIRVSKAIQRAITRIERADPVLGRALATRIRTGYVCRYESDPGQPIRWTVRLAA